MSRGRCRCGNRGEIGRGAGIGTCRVLEAGWTGWAGGGILSREGIEISPSFLFLYRCVVARRALGWILGCSDDGILLRLFRHHDDGKSFADFGNDTTGRLFDCHGWLGFLTVAMTRFVSRRSNYCFSLLSSIPPHPYFILIPVCCALFSSLALYSFGELPCLGGVLVGMGIVGSDFANFPFCYTIPVPGIGDCFIKANFKQIHRAKRALAFEYGNMLA